jgi:hypothetical protein
MRCYRAAVMAIVLAGALVSRARAGDGRNELMTPETVARRIKETKALGPKDWTKIPWAASLVDARRIAREEHCPVFLFTFEGNLATGRC